MTAPVWKAILHADLAIKRCPPRKGSPSPHPVHNLHPDLKVPKTNFYLLSVVVLTPAPAPGTAVVPENLVPMNTPRQGQLFTCFTIRREGELKIKEKHNCWWKNYFQSVIEAWRTEAAHQSTRPMSWHAVIRTKWKIRISAGFAPMTSAITKWPEYRRPSHRLRCCSQSFLLLWDSYKLL